MKNTIRILFSIYLMQISFSIFAQTPCPTNTDCSLALDITASPATSCVCAAGGAYWYKFEINSTTVLNLELSSGNLSNNKLYGPFSDFNVCDTSILNNSVYLDSINSNSILLAQTGFYLLKTNPSDICPFLSVLDCPNNVSFGEDFLNCDNPFPINSNYSQTLSCNCPAFVYWYSVTLAEGQNFDVNFISQNANYSYAYTVLNDTFDCVNLTESNILYLNEVSVNNGEILNDEFGQLPTTAGEYLVAIFRNEEFPCLEGELSINYQESECSHNINGSDQCIEPLKICSVPFSYQYSQDNISCDNVSASLWHSFNVISTPFYMNISDFFDDGFQKINVYGPYTSLDVENCTNILNETETPYVTITSTSNNANVLIQSTGYYLLEIFDKNCEGCLTFDLIEGSLSCCPQNQTCRQPINLNCVNNAYSFDLDCSDCNNNPSLPHYFTVNVNEGNTIHILENALNSSLTATSTFNFSIYEIIGDQSPCQASQNNVYYSENNISILDYTFPTSGTFLFTITNTNTKCPNFTINLDCSDDPCETCIGSFAPLPSLPGTESGRYLIGAWAKEINASNTKVDYDQPEIYIDFTLDDGINPPTVATVGPFKPQGAIIDGWQRIEEELIIPESAIDMEIKLTTAGADVLFDDIRFFPFDASMKTFVYDPINMRLAAELDERHYATFYEYDEEGKLVRIKKETEKGIMTIQETKSNSSKKNP